MAVTVGEDTYLTVIEADAYFLARYGYASWAALDTTVKEQALVSAAQQLDQFCAWYGYVVETNQALAFPRTPDASPTPQAIKNAQCEIAYAITTTESTSTLSEDPLKTLKAGSVTFEFDTESTGKVNPIVNSMAIKLLTPYGICGGGGKVPMVQQ